MQVVKTSTLFFLPLACACSLAFAEAIDLGCQDLAGELTERLAAEGLLDTTGKQGQRVREISVELCSRAEDTARRQHETDKQDALENWLTQPTGGKAGNARLKKLKR